MGVYPLSRAGLCVYNNYFVVCLFVFLNKYTYIVCSLLHINLDHQDMREISDGFFFVKFHLEFGTEKEFIVSHFVQTV